jgi:glycosyltransferase involved in cell wall biosynthesis
VRILMVNDMAIDAGWGAEAHLRRLVSGLTSAGDTVELFAGEVAHHGPAKLLDVWDPFARRALLRVIAAFRPDVVHHHNVLRELSASVLKLPVGVPSVMTVEDHRLLGVLDSPPRSPREFAKLPLSRLHRRVARNHVDVLVGVSQNLTRQLEALGFPSVMFLPQFADIPPADVVRLPVEEASDVVMAGRLVPDKGVRVLTEAFLEVADRHPEARLVVAGEGPEEAVVREAQRTLGDDRVRLTGKLDHRGVWSVLGRARLVAAPSIPTIRPEGAGISAIEAALMGRPVVVSDDIGHREFVDESGGGLVVRAGSVPALASALDTLLSDGRLARQLGESGRRIAEERRTVTAVVPRMREIYERAIALHRSRTARV